MMSMPPYTYAAGRLAEELRRDAIHRHAHVYPNQTARPLRFGPIDRFILRLERMLVTGERTQRPAAAVRGQPDQISLAGRARQTRPQGL